MPATLDPATALVLIDLLRGRASIPATPPEGVQAFIVLDRKDDRRVGIEILDASSRLHPDLLEEAGMLS